MLSIVMFFLPFFFLIVHRFQVFVAPGTKLESGPATLHFCNDILVLAKDLPPSVMGQWKLSDLRRYGAVPNGFIFEGGTRCGFCKYRLNLSSKSCLKLFVEMWVLLVLFFLVFFFFLISVEVLETAMQLCHTISFISVVVLFYWAGFCLLQPLHSVKMWSYGWMLPRNSPEDAQSVVAYGFRARIR